MAWAESDLEGDCESKFFLKKVIRKFEFFFAPQTQCQVSTHAVWASYRQGRTTLTYPTNLVGLTVPRGEYFDLVVAIKETL